MLKVIEYFEDKDKELWKKQIAAADRRAAGFLAELLNDIPRMESLLGKNSRLFLLVDNKKLISFATLSNQDCISSPRRFPWIGFVYTYPEYRNKGNSRFLLDTICERTKSSGYSEIWIATDQTNLYEHYGFTYIENQKDIYGDDDRVYCRKL